ncbi:amidohydrolase family protein [Marinigracilibium pacificum]|uniref:Amidohydrolase family protein n=1 Tax=Marinigracilibium pacificum TaxID=2729599 RepID=A0A848J5D3_9BACT|nr:amidohydrolase family protein [Marinigracilibium pacificum]NMM50458.1 amidohydrolase family protein [Marinigracilibium pacificum]
MKKSLFFFLMVIVGVNLYAQDPFPRNDVKDDRSGKYAFTNAIVHVDHSLIINNATLLIEDGTVLSVIENGSVPVGYYVNDLTGKHIYPAFVDPYTTFGMPKVESSGFSWGRREQITSPRKGPYNPNAAIKSDINASEMFNYDDKTANSFRKAGFGSVLSLNKDGIARGTSVFVNLHGENVNDLLVKNQAAAHYSFDKGSSKQDFPFSQMGAIALLRQTFMDAKWYNETNPYLDLTLEGLNNSFSLPQIFEVGDKLSVLRADKVGDEFGIQFIIMGAGDEYQMVDKIKETGASLILPLNFPDAYDVSDPFAALDITLEQMKHWEMAPANAAILDKNDIRFAFTASGLKNPSDYVKNVQKAVKNGLSEEKALAAMTSIPADLIGIKGVGNLKNGSYANFIITDKSLFEEGVSIIENWVAGDKLVVNQIPTAETRGYFTLSIGDEKFQLIGKGKSSKPSHEIKINDSTNIKTKSSWQNDQLSISFDHEGKLYLLSGWKSEKGFSGEAMVNSDWVAWNATLDSSYVEKVKKKEEKPVEYGEMIFPFASYGRTTIPEQKTYIIKNATVWTMEDDGILVGSDVLVEGGKIKKIGKNISANGAIEIDGTGKYLTPGIIDEHSHIALDGVNDVAVNSSMVRMKDVVDNSDINIYRQLAGGVTAAQLLHGSANPVGGQSALIKMRWGMSPQEMLIKDADEFIKFALGENVKRSSSSSSIRFPQTRMGVEQVFEDAFNNALDYERKWEAYNSLSKKEKAHTPAPRRDLVHEAMLEIINKERFITCHSYVQSEINMLMNLAERYGFRVNTFTHILEGYKVADKMAEHGVGGSTFADWWAYKWEVRYAIPYNATLMTGAGVTTAINSDDAEMGRRLNQEAAKSIKYGGMDKYEAMKMVTINPAKLLHLDERMGSVKEGKDADLVLWTDEPTSVYAKVEKTFVDGRVMFYVEESQALEQSMAKERERLIKKMLNVKENGGETQKPVPNGEKNFHCDDFFYQF